MSEKLKRLVRCPLHSNWDEGRDVSTFAEILSKRGYYATDEDIKWAWEQYSESYAAGWLSIFDEEEAFNGLLQFLEPEDIQNNGMD